MNFKRIAIFVALAALACYAIGLRATIVYDDREILEIDSRIAHFDQWHLYFTEPYNNGIENLYRPLTSFTFAIQHAIHGTNPLPYHIVNWLLHALVSVQVARLAWTWFEANTKRDRIALIAGLLFALHPVHVEVVVGIVGRSELLCSAFFLGVLQLVSRPLSRARSFGAIACLICAITSKEQGIVLIPVAIIVRALIARHERVAPEHPRAIATFALAAVFLACYVIAREQFFGLKFVWEKAFLDTRIQPLATISDDVTRIFAPLSLIGRALGYLFFPLNLNIDYANYISAKTDFNTIWPWLGMLAIVIWLVLFTRSIRKKDRATSTCLLAFGITYGLVSNIVMLIGTAFGERLLYLPSVFFILIISSWLVRLPARAMAIAVSVILLAFTLRSVTYAALWDDRLTLYASLVRQWPESARLRMLYGLELFERGQTARGIDESLRAVDCDPTYNRALLRAAQLLVKVDRLDEAEPLLARLDAVAPGSSRSVRAEIKERRLRLTQTSDPTTRPLDQQPAGE